MNLTIPGIGLAQYGQPPVAQPNHEIAQVLEAAKRLVEIKTKVDVLQYEWGDLEDEVLSLKQQMDDIDEEISNLYDEEEDLRRKYKKLDGVPLVATVGPAHIDCLDCALTWHDDSESCAFRADQHVLETGHRVVFVIPGGSSAIPGDCMEWRLSS